MSKGICKRRLEIGCVVFTCAVVVIRSLVERDLCLWFQMTFWLQQLFKNPGGKGELGFGTGTSPI